MFVVCVSIYVTPGHEEGFIAAIAKNHQGTVNEPGGVRFDVLQAEADPSHFFLYEAYQDPEAFVAHQKTEHYLTWRQAVAEWMAKPREAKRYHSLFPTDEQF